MPSQDTASLRTVGIGIEKRDLGGCLGTVLGDVTGVEVERAPDPSTMLVVILQVASYLFLFQMLHGSCWSASSGEIAQVSGVLGPLLLQPAAVQAPERPLRTPEPTLFPRIRRAPPWLPHPSAGG